MIFKRHSTFFFFPPASLPAMLMFLATLQALLFFLSWRGAPSAIFIYGLMVPSEGSGQVVFPLRGEIGTVKSPGGSLTLGKTDPLLNLMCSIRTLQYSRQKWKGL